MTQNHCSTPTPASRKLVHGIGLNNAPWLSYSNGKQTPAYSVWTRMLKSCYSAINLVKRPTYTGCSVSPEWLYFSNFESWFTKHHVAGYHLDKDLLVQGNRVYSAETCVFVPPALNYLLLDRRGARGLYPLGVSSHKDLFMARIVRYGHQTNLGYSKTPQLAHKQWQLAKADYIANYPVDDPRVRHALDLRVAQLRYDAEHNLITKKL